MSTKRQQLKTERLTLKALEDGDKDALLRMASDNRVRKTYMFPDFSSTEQEDAFFRRLKDISVSDSHFLYGIYLNDSLIGMINDCGMDGTSVELGYFLSPEHWGNGYAAEALQALIGELFRLGYRSVTAGYFEGNNASRRVMEKCGMRPMRKETTIDYRGTAHRCLFYEIVATGAEEERHPSDSSEI